MKHYTDQVLSQRTGLRILDAQVTLYLTGTATLATLYTKNDTTSAQVPNPFVATLGGISLYVPDGRYDIVIVARGETTTLTDVQIVDEIALLARVKGLESFYGSGGAPAAAVQLFATVQAGLQGTQSGDLFEVVGDNTTTFATIYRNVNGDATTLTVAPSTTAVGTTDVDIVARDPLIKLRSKINQTRLGTFDCLASNPGKVDWYQGILVIAILGNSYGQAYNASYNNSIATIAQQEWQAAFPWLKVYVDNYSIPGSWVSQYQANQIDGYGPPEFGSKPGILPAHAAAMAPGGDGRRRIPDIVYAILGGNDQLPNLFNSYIQTPLNYDAVTYGLINRFKTDPQLNDPYFCGLNTIAIPALRALSTDATNVPPRFILSAAFNMGWPVGTGLTLFPTYSLVTYNHTTRVMTSVIPTVFLPGHYDHNLLTTDGKSYMYISQFQKIVRIVAIDAEGTNMTIDDGNGGDPFGFDWFTTEGMGQCNFDNASQVFPLCPVIDANGNVVAPPGAPAGAPLGIELAPFGPKGELVHLGTRAMIINEITDRNLRLLGADLLDWFGEQRKITTSDVDIENQFPNNETIHPGDVVYALVRGPIRQRAQQAAYSIQGAT